MEQIKINNFENGGLIVTYYCNAKCKHCLYNCGPGIAKDYMQKDLLDDILTYLKKYKCTSVHIGGGEPFSNIEGLFEVIGHLRSRNIIPRFVETNAFWCDNSKQAEALQIVDKLKKLQVEQLLISISPFHNEFVKLANTKQLIKYCQMYDIKVLPWKAMYLKKLGALDINFVHKLSEHYMNLNCEQLTKIMDFYEITMRGRMLNSFAHYYPQKSTMEILKENQGSCNELLDDQYFHVDLYGNFQPDCPGLSVSYIDIGKPLNAEKYPFYTTLLSGGIKKLYEFAVCEYSFKATDKYFSKCHLCYDIRRFLVIQKNVKSSDLQPLCFYK